MTADIGLLRITLAAMRQTVPLGLAATLDDFFDHPLDNPLGYDRRLDGDRRVHEVVQILIVLDQAGRQGLAKLRAVTIKRVGLDPQLPGQHVGVGAIVDCRTVRHVDGLGNSSGDKRLSRRHHTDMTLG